MNVKAPRPALVFTIPPGNTCERRLIHSIMPECEG